MDLSHTEQHFCSRYIWLLFLSFFLTASLVWQNEAAMHARELHEKEVAAEAASAAASCASQVQNMLHPRSCPDSFQRVLLYPSLFAIPLQFS